MRSNSLDVPVQERLFEMMVEQSVHKHVRWSLKEIVLELPFDVRKFSSQDQISQRTVDQIEVRDFGRGVKSRSTAPF